MAYNPQELEAQALKVINEKKLVFIDDVCSYLPCNRATFYNLGLDKLDSIKDALNQIKTQMKSGLRSKWYNGNNPLTQMALYKLIGTDEEYHRIANTKTENKTEIIGGLEIKIVRE
jgi:hypothetical protein